MKLPFWPNPKGYRDIDFGLQRVYDLLKRLDNPHKKLPPTIHIAGTNGKGSTLSFLRAIFVEAGYSVSCYTSPHLVLFNERIVLNNKNISDEFLNDCLKRCQEAALQHPEIAITYFEGITVAAFLAFSLTKSDVLLLETGMGGRLDATNVIDNNLLSIITPIAFDHTEFLGKTLGKIAFEKAGIFKKNCPVIIGKQKKSALMVLKKQAAKLGCKVQAFGEDWQAINQQNRHPRKNSNYHPRENSNCHPCESRDLWILTTKTKTQSFATPSLQGAHQIENASTAIVAALSLQKKFKITQAQINSALQKTFWPARLQKIESGKFFKILPKNYDLVLDGSHNPQGATTLKSFLKSQKHEKKIAIFSMLKDKDCAGFLTTIRNEIDQLICLEIPDESKSRNKEEIFKIATKLKIHATIANNFDDAFKQILKNKNPHQTLITICGSLYLAGNFLEENEKT